jgi:hypothetical protein
LGLIYGVFDLWMVALVALGFVAAFGYVWVCTDLVDRGGPAV